MVAIVHNIRSRHNVGSIFRTSDGAGVEKIYLTGYTPAPIDKFGKKISQFAKVSLGAEDYLPWEKVKNIVKLIDKLKKDGYKILAIEQSSRSAPYYKLKATSPASPAGRYKLPRVALVVGNEVRGLSEFILEKCDKILEIPMRGTMVRQARHPRKTKRGKESLNVSVAYGIIAYHLAS